MHWMKDSHSSNRPARKKNKFLFENEKEIESVLFAVKLRQSHRCPAYRAVGNGVSLVSELSGGRVRTSRGV